MIFSWKALLKLLSRIQRTITEVPIFWAFANETNENDAHLNARQYYQARRYRDQVFGTADLFGEPSWDMLVALFIAIEEGRRLTAAELCSAAGAPFPTAYRWLAIMESAGLIVRFFSENDPQVSGVILSARAREDMKTYFKSRT